MLSEKMKDKVYGINIFLNLVVIICGFFLFFSKITSDIEVIKAKVNDIEQDVEIIKKIDHKK